MPSGYTAVFENREPSFEEFIWQCARAMGAFIHMRDDSFDAPIRMPDKHFDSYHSERLKEAVDDLQKYSSMSLEAAQIKMNKDYAKMEKEAKESMAKHDILRKRYESMLAKVNAWKVPSPDHEGFKKFMVEQLTQSIEWDCNNKYYIERLEAPHQTAREWLNDMVHQAQHDIEYHTKHLSEDRIREKSRFDWIHALMKDVPLPK